MFLSDFNKKLGQRIRGARAISGKSQTELAYSLGITQSTLSNYERGTRSVTVEHLIAIARELNVSLDYFIGTHPSVMVIRDSEIGQIVGEAERNPYRKNLLIEIWEYSKFRENKER